MSEYQPIPISAAKQIAAKYSKSQVIVVAWDPEHGRTHITTYGRDKEQCRQAALGGEAIAKALGLTDPTKTEAQDAYTVQPEKQ